MYYWVQIMIRGDADGTDTDFCLKKTMRNLLIIAMLSLCARLAQSQTPAVQNNITAVENSLIPYVPIAGMPAWNIQERMKYYQVQGLSVAVINNFKVEWVKSYGYADTLLKKRTQNHSIFSAGSISKLVLATSVFRLLEKGILSLDTPVNEYLSSWKIPENDFTRRSPVTLRMLLSHTAGTSQTSYFGFTPDYKELPSIVDILSGKPNSQSRGVVVNSEPNQEFRYSGGGSMIAQMAIMDITKSSFEEITQREVFGPLGMRNSTFAQPLPPSFKKNASWGYSSAPWYKGTPYVYPQQAAAGLHSTAGDLAKLVVALQRAYRGQGTFLKASSMQTMFSPQVRVSEGEYLEEMGLGPFLLQRKGNTAVAGKYFEFTGVNAGFVAYLIGSISEGYGAVIMLNSGDDFNGLGKEIRRAVAQVYGWNNFLTKPVSAASLTNLSEYAGRYRLGFDEVLSLRTEGKYLVENINNGPDIYCVPVASDTLVFTDFNVKGFFRRDSTGRIAGLKNEYRSELISRMKPDEFTPSELFAQKRYAEAKALIASSNLDESSLTYKAYSLLNKPSADLESVRVLLEVCTERYPTSAMAWTRWGEYYTQKKDFESAVNAYQKALSFDPNNQEVRDLLKQLKNR